MTHPNLTMVGAMRATAPGLAEELHKPIEAFREAFREVLANGMAKVDGKACLIWLPNFLKYNKPESPNVVKAWPEAFELLPECDLKDQILQQVSEFVKGLHQGFAKAFLEVFPQAFAKPMPIQEQEQEQEQEQDKDKAAGAAAPPRPEMFSDCWNRLSGPLPKVRELTDDRKRKVKARIAQGLTLEVFEQAVQKCTITPFLAGVNGREWKADFDWLIGNGTHITAVLEGKYDSSGAGPVLRDVPRPPSREEQAAMESAADAEERRAWEIWRSMSPDKRAAIPWTGRKFEDEPETAGAVA